MRVWGRLGRGSSLGGVLEKLRARGEPDYHNALREGVVARRSVIGETLSALHDAGLRGVLMSGSGATCFGLAESRIHAEGVAAGLKEAHPAWWVWATRTC